MGRESPLNLADVFLGTATRLRSALRRHIPELRGSDGDVLEAMNSLRESDPERVNFVFGKIQQVNRLVMLSKEYAERTVQ